MRKSIISAALALLTLIMAGCAGPAAASWKPVNPDNAKYSGKRGFSADLPAGWMVYEEDKTPQTLLLSRHGVPLSFIQVKLHPLSEPLPHTGLAINAHMQSYEIAEIVINNLRAAPGIFDLTVEELAPDAIDSREAFSLLLTYAMENGMRRRCLIYGFVQEGGKYYTEIGLYALEDYYFDAATGEFLRFAGSVKMR